MAIHDSFNTGVHIEESNHVQLLDTVIHRTIGQSVDVHGSDNVTISRNLALTAVLRVDNPTVPNELWEQMANFRVGWRGGRKGPRCADLQMHGNVAAGSNHFGFFVQDDPAGHCGAAEAGVASAFTGNSAKAARAGLCMFERSPGGCMTIADFQVKKAA